ncbi:T9SS type A sorting domain-containing protein, partial [candidate division WOR-3 bacterium]|nr:T9SS type A sorting domain-containing protein [candidate division WOR-3 bacterium]
GDTLIIYATAHNYKMDSIMVVIEDTDYNASLINLEFTENIFSLNTADGIFSAGDNGYIKPEIQNTGTDTLFNVYLTIKSEFERISIVDTLLFITDTILPGQTILANDSTQTIVLDTLNPFLTEKFYCSIISDSLIKAFTLFREIKAPLLEYSERNIINKSNNIIISGDILLIVFGIKNSGNYDDRGIYIHFETISPLLEIPNDTLYIPHIPFENIVLADTVQFIINDTISTFKIINYNMIINDSLGNNYTIRDSFIVNRLDYLVIDYDNNNNSGPFIDSVLTVLGYSGNYKTAINRSELYQYKNVFMCRGVYPNATFLSGTDSIASLIDTLLESGDINFYMEGGECWYYDVVDLGGFSFNEKCGINPIGDGGSITGNIDGIDPYIANSMSFVYSGDNSYLDFIDDTMTGRNIFINGSNIHGVSNIGSSYRSVGLSFELAGLTDVSSPSLRSELLNNIMNFFNGLTGIIDTKIREKQFSFDLIKSNPFSRNIVFRIDGEPGLEVKINIYDITGRMIYKNNIVLNSKTNNLKWNNANEVPGGIYFIKAITSKGEQIKSKIIFID